jgi:ketosteroid isomerase-like protein
MVRECTEEARQMPGTGHDSLAVIERLIDAINRHDLEAFLACVAPDYQSTQPLHPDRTFQGREQVRQNWTAVFAGMPDVQWSVLQSAVNGDTVWIEVQGRGTRASDGAPIEFGGILIQQVRDGQIVAARIYFEEIATDGAGITASIAQLYERPPDDRGA